MENEGAVEMGGKRGLKGGGKVERRGVEEERG